jgi:hypothetical protein
MTFQRNRPTEISRVQSACFLCDTIIDVRFAGNSVKPRRARYAEHIVRFHPRFSNGGRAELVDAMVRHERMVTT